MTVSPTLGISPFNPGPLENFAAMQSQQLQQFGQQLRQDVTTIQGNEQLKDMAQQLQGVNPGLVDDGKGGLMPDPNFASQMTQAIAANPLGAHTPAGISIISQLGAAHQGALQQAIWAQRIGGMEGVAGINQTGRANVAGINQQGRETTAGINQHEINFAPNPDDPSAPPTLQVNPNAPTSGAGKWRVNGNIMYNDVTGERKDMTQYQSGNWKPVQEGDGTYNQEVNTKTGEFRPISSQGGTPTAPKPIEIAPGAIVQQGGKVTATNPKPVPAPVVPSQLYETQRATTKSWEDAGEALNKAQTALTIAGGKVGDGSKEDLAVTDARMAVMGRARDADRANKAVEEAKHPVIPGLSPLSNIGALAAPSGQLSPPPTQVAAPQRVFKDEQEALASGAKKGDVVMIINPATKNPERARLE